MKVSLFDHNGSDRHIAAYFWTSTDKDDDAFVCPEAEVERVIRFGMKAQPVPHATPFGHSHVTVKADDIPLFVVAQWQRHRVQNYSQKSLRYTTSEGAYYIPEAEDMRVQLGRPGHYTFRPVQDNGTAQWARKQIDEAGKAAYEAYGRLVAAGVAMELARTVLPVGTLTRMYATASLRNWLGWLVQRNDSHAQLEIQRCAAQVEDILDELYPITMRLWREYGRRVV